MWVKLNYSTEFVKFFGRYFLTALILNGGILPLTMKEASSFVNLRFAVSDSYKDAFERPNFNIC